VSSKLRLDEGVRLWIQHADALVRHIRRQADDKDELQAPARVLFEHIGVHIAATVTGDDVVELTHNAGCVIRAAAWVSDVLLADLCMWALHGPPSIQAARQASSPPPTVAELQAADTFNLFNPASKEPARA
jgi:hypothetical protein